MSIAKCHKESWLDRSRCIMWFKALSWQGPFSSLTLSVKTGEKSREKKTHSWFRMKPKWVFVLALRNTIVTALDHLQWKVITPTHSSFKKTTLFPPEKNQDSQRRFVLRAPRLLRLPRGASFCGIFMRHHNAHTFNSKPHDSELNTIYTQVEPTNHIKKRMYNYEAPHIRKVFFWARRVWVFFYVCSTRKKTKALNGRDISTNRVS